MTDPEYEELVRQQKIIKDRVRGIVEKHLTGMYLCGRAGTSKSYTVRTTLEELGVPYEYVSGHLTPIGLFQTIERNRDRIIVLDDVSSLFSSPIGLQILLAALGNTHDGDARIVRYCKAGRDMSVQFTGGIIAISNLAITNHTKPVLEALADRVQVINYDPSDGQIIACIRHIAAKGLKGLTPNEAKEVAEFCIENYKTRSLRPTIRFFCDKAVPDFSLWKKQKTETHWRDLVISSLESQLIELTEPINETCTRNEMNQRLRRIASAINDSFETRKEKLEAWSEKTGLAQPTFYRHLKKSGKVRKEKPVIAVVKSPAKKKPIVIKKSKPVQSGKKKLKAKRKR